MNLLIEDPVPQKSFFKKPPVLIGIVLIAFALTAFVAFVAYQKLSGEKEGPHIVQEATPQEQLNALYATEAIPPVQGEGTDRFNYGLRVASTSTEGIEGYILFTALPKETTPTSTNQVYFIDASAEGSLPSLFFPESVLYSAFIEFVNVFDPSSFFVDAMHYAISQLPAQTTYPNHSVQQYGIENQTLEGYASIQGHYIQNVDVTQDGSMVAYNRQTVDPGFYIDLVPIENWEIVISDLENDRIVAVLDDAVQPKWSPDGTKLVMLKQDGLYVYDVAQDVVTKVVDTSEGQTLSTAMIDVSPDGSHLVWTIARAGIIIMHEITSWEPFTLIELGRVHADDTEYYWPQFSPDGEHYVVQAINTPNPDTGERENARFQIRSTAGRSVLRSYQIDQFNFNSFFTDTWIRVLPEEALMLNQQ